MPAYVADSISVQRMQKGASCNTLAEGLPLLSHVAMANGTTDDLASKIQVTFALMERGRCVCFIPEAIEASTP